MKILSRGYSLGETPIIKRGKRGWLYLWGLDIGGRSITTLYRPLFEVWRDGNLLYIETPVKLIAIGQAGIRLEDSTKIETGE